MSPTPVETRFNSFDFFSSCMKQHAPQKWYIAGGCAAWLHIEKYTNKDNAYLTSIKDKVNPGDVEIGLEKAAAATIKERYGEKMQVNVTGTFIHIDVQIEEPPTFNASLTRCVKIDGAHVFSVPSLITAYERAGDPGKAEKRKLRLAMLKLIKDNKRIDKDSVEALASKPTMFQELLSKKK